MDRQDDGELLQEYHLNKWDNKCRWTKISGWDYNFREEDYNEQWSPTSFQIYPAYRDPINPFKDAYSAPDGTTNKYMWGYIDWNDVIFLCLPDIGGLTSYWMVLSGMNVHIYSYIYNITYIGKRF